jgi:hypothetical protein
LHFVGKPADLVEPVLIQLNFYPRYCFIQALAQFFSLDRRFLCAAVDSDQFHDWGHHPRKPLCLGLYHLNPVEWQLIIAA